MRIAKIGTYFFIILTAFSLIILLSVGCEDSASARDGYVGSSAGTGTSTSSTSSNDSTKFGIFSETVTEDVVWDSDCKLDLWTDDDAGATCTEISAGTGEGTKAWQFTGTGDWMGFGVRVEPLTNYRDLSSYSYLNFMYKGTKAFKIGLKEGPTGGSSEAWIESSTLVSSYSLALDGAWHTLKIPLTAFTSVSKSEIQQYLMFAADVGNHSYSVGDNHYFDNLYFSAD